MHPIVIISTFCHITNDNMTQWFFLLTVALILNFVPPSWFEG